MTDADWKAWCDQTTDARVPFRDEVIAHVSTLRSEVAALREALETVTAAYTLERDSLYDVSTNSEGEYTPGDDGENDERAVAEMDAILRRAAAVLAKHKG